ncbi:uncharacterized protein LOC141619388 [Silene latifolia]|uniref:uncharacterized protein LOC141619388 n=1 Tax=Silene latifolia TaxID=37657 RepID=UPI003D785F0F
MIDYNLVEHEWFSDLYDIREQWIPAYFKDVFMSGFMRVTSRSESENSFFDRHYLWLHNKIFQKIPEKYIVQRWTKAAMSKPVSDKDGRAIDVPQLYSDRKSLTTELWQEVYSCVSVAEYDEEDMNFLIEKLDMIDKRSFPANKKDKMKEMEKYVVFKRHEKLVIQLPAKSKNKGRVRGKRIESQLLKALKNRGTEKSYCKTCGRQ